MIPQKIHYCWLSNDPIPEEMLQYMKTWKQYLPDYEFIKWDFSRFDKSSSAWVQEAFENKKYAFAADYIRLYALYHFGGIYMDMDVEVVKPLDDLLGRKYLLAYEREPGQGIEAGIMGTESHDPYIYACLQYYRERHFVKPDRTLDTKPLPQIMQEILDGKNWDITPLTKDYFTAKSYLTGEIQTSGNTYTIHHFAATWHSKAQEMIRKIDTAFYSKSAAAQKIGWCISLPWRIKDHIETIGVKKTAALAFEKLKRGGGESLTV